MLPSRWPCRNGSAPERTQVPKLICFPSPFAGVESDEIKDLLSPFICQLPGGGKRAKPATKLCLCVCMTVEGPQCLQGLERPPSDPSALSPFPFSSGPVGRNPTRWSKITLSERRFRPNGRFGGLGTTRGESKSASKMASNPIPNFIRGSWLNPSHPCLHLGNPDSSESVETLVVFFEACAA